MKVKDVDDLDEGWPAGVVSNTYNKLPFSTV